MYHICFLSFVLLCWLPGVHMFTTKLANNVDYLMLKWVTVYVYLVKKVGFWSSNEMLLSIV